jgi:hypothetical protein
MLQDVVSSLSKCKLLDTSRIARKFPIQIKLIKSQIIVRTVEYKPR